jgi:predicted transcriptional regulator
MRTIQTTEKPNGKSPYPAPCHGASSQIPVAAIFSFLKETRGMDTWTTRDMAETLGITAKKVSAVLPFLSMQGYVRQVGQKSEWMTTMAGATVSGSSIPHFLRESVERATESLAQRIKEFNKSSDSSFAINNAVAFGDFLRDLARVQAADVGILLNRKSKARAMAAVRDERTAGQALLNSLRNSSLLLHLSLYEDWMGARTHRKLI